MVINPREVTLGWWRGDCARFSERHKACAIHHKGRIEALVHGKVDSAALKEEPVPGAMPHRKAGAAHRQRPSKKAKAHEL